jgi:phosphatidylinositol 4-kinase A
MEYKPTDMQRRAKHERYVQDALAPHLIILRYLRQHLQPCGAVDTHTTLSIYRLVLTSLKASKHTSAHPLAREGRVQLILLGLQLVREGRLSQRLQSALQIAVYKFALSWYAHPPMYSPLRSQFDNSVAFGNNRIQTTTDYHLLTSLSTGLDRDPDTGVDIHDMKRLLQILLKDETFRVYTWLSPLANDASVAPVVLEEGAWPSVVRSAWKLDPVLAVHMSQRFASPSLQKEVRRLIVANPEDVITCPVAAQIMLGDTLSSDLQFQLKVTPFRDWTYSSTSCTGRQLFHRLR